MEAKAEEVSKGTKAVTDMLDWAQSMVRAAPAVLVVESQAQCDDVTKEGVTMSALALASMTLAAVAIIRMPAAEVCELMAALSARSAVPAEVHASPLTSSVTPT
jgi:hypothetical protein